MSTHPLTEKTAFQRIAEQNRLAAGIGNVADQEYLSSLESCIRSWNKSRAENHGMGSVARVAVSCGNGACQVREFEEA